MVMACGLTLHLVTHVMGFLQIWVASCLVIANEIARGLRDGEIGPFTVG